MDTQRLHRRGLRPASFWFCFTLLTAFCIFLTGGGAGLLAVYADTERETPVVRAVRKVSPAVVNISSEQATRQRANPFGRFGMDSFFDNFFRDFFEHQPERQFQRTSLGSGVIIDGQRGYILTNAHVVQNTTSIAVTLNDQRQFDAQIVGADPDSDLAVLQISPDNDLPAIEMGRSDDLMIGETIIAIGNPFGFSHTVTTGVISALNRSIRAQERVYHDFIQIDASINPGNSGGPLLNIKGELVGINTAIYAKAQGIGFAIPISKAQRIISDLIHYGEVVHAWIGIEVQELDTAMAAYFNLPEDETGQPPGVLVKDVFPDSPGARAGLQRGDVITHLNAQALRGAHDYQQALRGVAAGSRLNLTRWRDGQAYKLELTATVFPPEQAPALIYRLLGIRVSDITPGLRSQHRLASRAGIVITEVTEESQLGQIGVRPGDVIRRIDDVVISATGDFEKAMIRFRNKPTVVLLVQRGEQMYYITVKL